MTEASGGRRAVSFEQACTDAKRLADEAVQASTKLLRASKELAKAADDGDIAKLHKSADKLASAMATARQDVSNATSCWPLSTEDEDRLLRDLFEAELIAAAATEGVTIRRHEQRLVVFPSVLRVLPAQRAVQIDRKKVTAIRPSKLVQALKAAAAKKPRLAPERFIETLYGAYRLVVGAEGNGTTLAHVYDALTLLPDARRDYSVSDFTRDVFLLDRSGVTTTKTGVRLSLPAATGTKGGSKVFEFVDPSGEPVTYYGIRFTP
jgi:hypothetical protein